MQNEKQVLFMSITNRRKRVDIMKKQMRLPGVKGKWLGAAAILAVFFVNLPYASGTSARERVSTKDGLITVEPIRSPGNLVNPWPEKWEKAFKERVDYAIKMFAGAVSSATTDEHEKWGIPATIGAFYAGDQDAAIGALQAQDLQATRDHEHTKGIDLYWCFTLKGQMHKWFGFKDDFSEKYQKQFSEAMRIWTQDDPRPSLEYVLSFNSPYPAVREFVSAKLNKMWRNKEQLLEMAAEAEAEGHPNKKRFAEYIRQHAEEIGSEHPGDDFDKWYAWWGAISGGDWMIFEEYERRVNPNPHPKYGIGSGPVGGQWEPGTRGMQADARNTDNLRGMRETAIYLAAEASGNETIRLLYKDRLRRTAISFWNVGNGEWDSEGYLAHTQAAYVNLFTFARDEEVRGYAKAILDYLFTSAAMKYWRGAWGGPVCRDYGNISRFSTAAKTAWLFFGNAPENPPKKDLEWAFFFGSGYRPPAATVALARKQFDRPVQIFSSHPVYSNWLPGNDQRPHYHETMSYGETWQMGSLARGHAGDVNGFKLLLQDDRLGATYLIPTTGKLRNPATSSAGKDNIAQWLNSALWINGQDNTVPFSIVVPKNSEMEKAGNNLLLKTPSAWVALMPLNLKLNESTQPLKKNDDQVLLTGEGGKGLSGFALEIGSKSSHGSYDAFAKTVREKARAEITGDGKIVYTTTDGRKLSMEHGAAEHGLPRIWRNDEEHLWDNHFALWRSPGDDGPINLGWKERRLEINAGGYTFTGELAEDGTYSWSQTLD